MLFEEREYTCEYRILKANGNPLTYRQHGEKVSIKMSNNEIIRALESIIATAEEFKDAYFLKPPTNAICRRSYEKHHSIPFFTFEYNGIEYTCEYRISCSGSNVYAEGLYTRNGNKTTLTAIKNVLKKMKAEVTANE